MASKSRIWVVALVLRVCLGVFFLYTGGEKLFRLDDFTRDVANYRMVMQPWDAVIAYTLPCFEIVTGLCLLLGLLVRGALMLATGMMLAFLVATGQAWYFGFDINCGCFSSSDDPTLMPLHVALLVAILLVIGFLYFTDRYAPKRVFSVRRLKLP
jgi:uncharacterized membrane protein YphA (DoxX/SURF4 family)